MLRQSESKKNLLVNFNQVHTYSEWFQFVMKWDFFELFWEKQSFVLKVFCTKGVLKNFAKFIRKHLCQSLFFNKVADLRPATLFKKRLWHRHFPVDFGKFLRTPIFTEHLQWLLLILTHFRSSRPEVFLEISQNSQENTCTSFYLLIKLGASGLWILGNMSIVIVL